MGGKSSSQKIFVMIFIVIWAVQMAAAFYFCTQKQGFHEDEYYTYYSTARTNGFYVENEKWMERDAYRDEFVVLRGERFQYGLVRLVQSWDVHPPVYYWFFHTAASCFPEIFSKWIGLAVNLFFHGINIGLLTYLSYLASGKNERLALTAAFVYGLSPAAVSGVVFIRMYELLTTWTLLCAILHVKAMGTAESGHEGQTAEETEDRREGQGRTIKTGVLAAMAAVTYLGFLTQYYYFIFLFYMAVAFCIYLLWRDRNIWNCLRYGVSQAFALVLAYLTYPSCLGQMFRGQRGAQATENFFDLSNTLGRIQFFGELLDEYAFGKMLPVLLLLFIMLFITKKVREGFGAVFWVLLFTASGYFLTVSKTALLLGNTSVRYQLPVYGLTVLLFFMAFESLWRRYAAVAAAVICLAANIAGLLSGKVVFLYPEDKEQVEFARAQSQADVPAVYLYQAGADWCVWAVANELLEYPAVYFAQAGETAALHDETVRGAAKLVVYVDKEADQEGQIARVFDSNPRLENYELKFEEKYCDVYYFWGQ